MIYGIGVFVSGDRVIKAFMIQRGDNSAMMGLVVVNLSMAGTRESFPDS